jgi:hypothetical protein
MSEHISLQAVQLKVLEQSGMHKASIATAWTPFCFCRISAENTDFAKKVCFVCNFGTHDEFPIAPELALPLGTLLGLVLLCVPGRVTCAKTGSKLAEILINRVIQILE